MLERGACGAYGEGQARTVKGSTSRRDKPPQRGSRTSLIIAWSGPGEGLFDRIYVQDVPIGASTVLTDPVAGQGLCWLAP